MVEKIINEWEDSHNGIKCEYDKNAIKSIAINCVSLTNAWINNSKKSNSLEVILINKDLTVNDILHGVDKNNLPLTLLNIITDKSKVLSSVVVNSFHYDENNKKIVEKIGTLDIS